MNKRREIYEVIENDLHWLFQTHKSIHKHNGKGHILADGKSIRYNLSLKKVHEFPFGTYLDTKKSLQGYHWKACVNLKDLKGTDFIVFGNNSDPILENLRVKKPTHEILARNTENRKDYFTVWFRVDDFVNFNDECLWNSMTSKNLVDKSPEIAAYKKEPEPSNKWNNDTSIETTILVDGKPKRFDSKLKCYEYLKKIKQTTHKNYQSWRICFNRKTRGGTQYSVTTFKDNACVSSNVSSEEIHIKPLYGFFSDETITLEKTLEETKFPTDNNEIKEPRMTTEEKKEPEKIKRIKPKDRREYEEWCESVPQQFQWTLEEWVAMRKKS